MTTRSRISVTVRRWFIIFLTLGIAAEMAWFSYQDRKITRCQARYNVAVAEVTQKRAQIAEEDRDSLVTFIRTISTAKESQDAREALDKYLKIQDSLDKRRAANPIPKLKAGSC